MKTVLITGANKGIGFEIAKQLLENEFHVIISARDEIKLDEAIKRLKAINNANTRLDKIVMDVSKFESVKAAADLVSAKGISINVIINNAAILLKKDSSLIHQDDEILKSTINTNCYGPLRVIHAFLPLMEIPGKIINLSSEGGSMSEPVGGWSPAYCISKTMLNSITRQLAHELSNRNISVNAVCPGWVKTDMGGKAAPRPVEKGAETAVWLTLEDEQDINGKFLKDKRVINW